jgi:uncharacterized protein YjbI with pentapeptide repeats/energy-coupling factor transporter ATP-binding protein EcfA2
MIPAQHAPVKPRVFSDGGSDAFLLEDEIARLLEARMGGLVAILGPAGSGKTTALQHLAAVFPANSGVLLLDENDARIAMRTALWMLAASPGLIGPLFDENDIPVETEVASVRLVVYAATTAREESHLAVYRLASWDKDDLIEYLLSMHRPRCAAVMARVRDDDHGLLGGVPELWRTVLDRLAFDDTIPDVRRALHRHLESHLVDVDVVERARSACLNAALSSGGDLTKALVELARPGFAERLVRLLQHPAVQLMLASERIAAELHGDGDCDLLAKRLPRALVQAAAPLVANDRRAREHLYRLLDGPSWSHAMSASLLHAARVGWVPTPGHRPWLAGAYLDGARWPGIDLSGAYLGQACLAGADLSRADLANTFAHQTDLSLAQLLDATLDAINADEADLSHAKLSRARARLARFQGACLEGATFDYAVLRRTYFGRANLTGASFRGADLSQARFIDLLAAPPELVAEEACRANAAMGAKLEGADFTSADLTEAILWGLPLRLATWTGARFTRAKLNSCDLEGLELPGADFTEADLSGALLTGTTMPGACFARADLHKAGLADVDWEGADLRGADLRGATFHLGSSRSGLVGSPIACEGSRTGFYTDDYDDQTYKAPEEIRKANLCGADLRGAALDGVDFYLVDLRGAIFDADQAEHLRRCGAILEARV